MKVRYEFVTGEVVEVEVSEEMGSIIVDLDRIEYNNNKKESRRHCALSSLGEGGKWLVDPNSDFTRQEEQFPFGLNEELWERALSLLTEKQKAVFIAVYQEGYKPHEYAAMAGISKATVSKTLSRGRKRIQKVFKNV